MKVLYYILLLLFVCNNAIAEEKDSTWYVVIDHNQGKITLCTDSITQIDFEKLSSKTNESSINLTSVHDTVTITRTSYVTVSKTASWFYCTENQSVSNYLNTANYINYNYDKSVIETYTKPYTSFKKDKPASITIANSNAADSVQFSFDPEFSTITRTLYVKGHMNSAIINNLIPNKKYYFRTFTNGEITYQSTFYTIGDERMIDIDGVNNVRDIGGWMTTSGKKIKYNLIFRGAELDGYNSKSYITKDGIDCMKNILHVKQVIDLRTDDQSHNAEFSPLGDDVGYCRLPVAPYILWYKRYYEALRYIINTVKDGNGVYFHCAVGADRTGTLAALLEGILGVNEADLIKDYELTSFSGQIRKAEKSDVKEDSSNFHLMMEEIKSRKGDTLQDKFIDLFLDYGITKEEINEFIDLMLE